MVVRSRGPPSSRPKPGASVAAPNGGGGSGPARVERNVRVTAVSSDHCCVSGEITSRIHRVGRLLAVHRRASSRRRGARQPRRRWTVPPPSPPPSPPSPPPPPPSCSPPRRRRRRLRRALQIRPRVRECFLHLRQTRRARANALDDVRELSLRLGVGVDVDVFDAATPQATRFGTTLLITPARRSTAPTAITPKSAPSAITSACAGREGGGGADARAATSLDVEDDAKSRGDAESRARICAALTPPAATRQSTSALSTTARSASRFLDAAGAGPEEEDAEEEDADASSSSSAAAVPLERPPRRPPPRARSRLRRWGSRGRRGRGFRRGTRGSSRRGPWTRREAYRRPWRARRRCSVAVGTRLGRTRRRPPSRRGPTGGC